MKIAGEKIRLGHDSCVHVMSGEQLVQWLGFISGWLMDEQLQPQCFVSSDSCFTS